MMARKRSRSIGGPIAVPLGTAYSEPRASRPPHRRSASTHHRDPAYEREREIALARSRTRAGSGTCPSGHCRPERISNADDFHYSLLLHM